MRPTNKALQCFPLIDVWSNGLYLGDTHYVYLSCTPTAVKLARKTFGKGTSNLDSTYVVFDRLGDSVYADNRWTYKGDGKPVYVGLQRGYINPAFNLPPELDTWAKIIKAVKDTPIEFTKGLQVDELHPVGTVFWRYSEYKGKTPSRADRYVITERHREIINRTEATRSIEYLCETLTTPVKSLWINHKDVHLKLE